jgi:hypothetical protein
VTLERLDIDGIISGANSANAVFYVERCSDLKMWGCKITNTTYANKDTLNLFPFLNYSAPNCSIQCNTFSNTSGGLFEKSGNPNGGAGMTVRFNIINSGQIKVSTQGGTPLMDFHIISNNILASTKETSHSSPVMFTQSSTDSTTTKTQINNNVFYDYDYVSMGHITVDDAGYNGLLIFNNIFYETDDAVRLNPDTGSPEYWNHNLYFNETLSRQPRFVNGVYPQIDLATLKSTSSYEENAVASDPLFVDAASGDFTLQNNSPAISGGVDGTRMGVYLMGSEKIGAEMFMLASPEKMEAPEVTIIG